MAKWEQQAAIAVFHKTRALIVAGLQAEPPVQLTPEQGGRFIAEAWNVQVFRHIPQPKSSYVADWDDLPEWQRKQIRIYFSSLMQQHARNNKQPHSQTIILMSNSYNLIS